MLVTALLYACLGALCAAVTYVVMRWENTHPED